MYGRFIIKIGDLVFATSRSSLSWFSFLLIEKQSVRFAVGEAPTGVDRN